MRFSTSATYTSSRSDCTRNLKLAYKAYGTLNPTRDNAIIYPTSFVATRDDAARLIGVGRALDPEKCFIIVPDIPLLESPG